MHEPSRPITRSTVRTVPIVLQSKVFICNDTVLVKVCQAIGINYELWINLLCPSMQSCMRPLQGLWSIENLITQKLPNALSPICYHSRIQLMIVTTRQQILDTCEANIQTWDALARCHWIPLSDAVLWAWKLRPCSQLQMSQFPTASAWSKYGKHYSVVRQMHMTIKHF